MSQTPLSAQLVKVCGTSCTPQGEGGQWRILDGIYWDMMANRLAILNNF